MANNNKFKKPESSKDSQVNVTFKPPTDDVLATEGVVAEVPAVVEEDVVPVAAPEPLPVVANKAKPAAPAKIVVVAIKELPAFKGRRISVGMEFEILPTQFDAKLMVKKSELKK